MVKLVHSHSPAKHSVFFCQLSKIHNDKPQSDWNTCEILGEKQTTVFTWLEDPDFIWIIPWQNMVEHKFMFNTYIICLIPIS